MNCARTVAMFPCTVHTWLCLCTHLQDVFICRGFHSETLCVSILDKPAIREGGKQYFTDTQELYFIKIAVVQTKGLQRNNRKTCQQSFSTRWVQGFVYFFKWRICQ